MGGDDQSGRFSNSVLAVRENAGGPFAVLDVGAFCLFEQAEAREHGGQSSTIEEVAVAIKQTPTSIEIRTLLSSPFTSPPWPPNGIPDRGRGPSP